MSTLPTHLVIVCCHGIWIGGPANGYDEAEWLIAGFQKGETATFVEHIRAGVRALAEDEENAVLAFSGGPTRPETKLSEAQSYADIASRNSYWGLLASATAQRRILIEDRALDSYHNVLFSLTLFFAAYGTWPARLTIVSHAFKRERLVDLHCRTALGLDRVGFVGIDPPAMAAGAPGKEAAMAGVVAALGEWREDPHGRGESLRGKRARRNPWGQWQGVFVRDMEEEDRRRAGLVTRGWDEDETLVDNAPKPWS